MNVIGIAWDTVECEVNLGFWYERKQDESRFLGNMVLLVICSLCDLVLFAIWSS